MLQWLEEGSIINLEHDIYMFAYYHHANPILTAYAEPKFLHF